MGKEKEKKWKRREIGKSYIPTEKKGKAKPVTHGSEDKGKSTASNREGSILLTAHDSWLVPTSRVRRLGQDDQAYLSAMGRVFCRRDCIRGRVFWTGKPCYPCIARNGRVLINKSLQDRAMRAATTTTILT